MLERMNVRAAGKNLFNEAADGSADIKGAAGLLCDSLIEKQLCDRNLWARFVNEFRTRIDAQNGGWRGEYWGKMMRGAVCVYRYSKDKNLYAALSETVDDLLTTADEQGRITTFPPEHEFFAWDLWCRKYVLLGLEFFLEICTDEVQEKRIIDALCRQCDYLCSHIGEGKRSITDTSKTWGGLNSASILEPVIRLYRICPKPEYMAFAKHIIASGGSSFGNVFEQARENKKYPFEYGVNKAYEMMSCFEGLLEYYYLTGDETARQTVIDFAGKVAESDVTVIGSCGCTHELFDNSYLRQTADVPDGAIMQETCVTVTWLKLCEKLLLLTGDSRWADMAEKAFYNAYLGAFNPDARDSRYIKEKFADGLITKETPLYFDSYSPLTAGYRGVKTGGFQVMSDGGYFGCCACIAAAGAGIFACSQLFETADGAAVAGFEDGRYAFSAKEAACELTISGNYPFGNGCCKLDIKTDKPVRFVLIVRNPGNAENAKLVCGTEEIRCENGWFRIEREWQSVTELKLYYDISLKITHAPQYENTTVYNIDWKTNTMFGTVFAQTEREKRKISLSRGPVVLAAEEGYSLDDISEKVEPVMLPAIDAKAEDGRRMTVQVPLADGRSIKMCDYASAGMNWDKKIAAWIDG